MNPEQVKSGVRWLQATVGPFLISHGYASEWSLEMAAGVIISVAPLIWSMFAHTEDNAVRVVDTISKNPKSPVVGVLIEPTEAGQKLANSMPGKTTVVAGSTAAAALARLV